MMSRRGFLGTLLAAIPAASLLPRGSYSFEIDPTIPKADITTIGIVTDEGVAMYWAIDCRLVLEHHPDFIGCDHELERIGGWSIPELDTIARLVRQGVLRAPILGHS